MRQFIFPLSLLLLGCQTEEPTDETGQDPQDITLTAGHCDTDPEEFSPEGDYDTLTVSGEVFLLHDVVAEVFHTQAELDAFSAEHAVTIEGVDFSSQAVMLASAGASSTCGFSEPTVTIGFGASGTSTSGSIHMQFDVTDYSGTCDAVCDMSWTELKAIAVPAKTVAEATYSVCTTLLQTCQ